MARLEPDGVTLQFLPSLGYRLLRALRKCQNELRIPNCKLTNEDLANLHVELAFCYGEYLKTHKSPDFLLAGKKIKAGQPPDRKEVVKLLNDVAANAKQLADLMLAPSGFTKKTEVEFKARDLLLNWLSLNPEISEINGFKDVEKLRHYVDKISNMLSAIGAASEFAAWEFDQFKGKSGRPEDTWYIEFTRILINLCQRHNIKPTLSNTEKKNGKPYGGKLFKVATCFEKLLPFELRCASEATRYGRLKKARASLQKQE